MNKYDFIEVIPAEAPEEGYWAVIQGANGRPEIIDDCFDTPEEADRAGRAYRREYLSDRRADAREAAMEAAMLGGCDAYNEVMGY
ncbi:MAG TPA: hypothetical protein VFM97_00310 [Gammaproteobacteria bacterium]|nr:hypothetical protein [Gammaproteobacteria bacterium]